MAAHLGKLGGALFALMMVSLMAYASAWALRGAWDELTRPEVCYTVQTEEENLR